MVAERPAPPLPRWLTQNRNFVLLWAAYGISAFGDHLSEMALFREAGGLDRDDATRVQALMSFCFFLPFVVLGPVAGWWADRFNRKWTMIAADLVRAAIMLSLTWTVPALFGLGLGDWSVTLPLALAGAFAAFFSPSRQAMVPTLIRDDQLVRANALISALGTIGAILSTVVGGWLVELAVAGHFGVDWNFRLDAATFVASAVLLAGIDLRRSRAVPHDLPAGLWTPLREGFHYVRAHRRVLQMILLATVFWAAAGVIISVVPAIVRDVFGGSFAQAGTYRGLIVAGLALGAALLTLVGRALPISLGVLLSVAGGAFWVCALNAACIWKLHEVFAGLCLLMVGVHGAGILVTSMVVIQRFVPDSRRGRVFGVSDTATMAAIVATTALLGLPRIEHLDRYVPWLLGGVGLLLAGATAVAWRTYRRGQALSAATWLIWRLVRFYAALWAGARRVGPCTVPRRGPVIVAANHTSGIDPLVMLGTCHLRLISFIVEQKYYRVPVARWFMKLDGCIPVDRDNPTKSFLSGALRLLRDGGCLGIFPQGTYLPPGEPPPPARPGVGALALRTGAVVIPCHISGAWHSENPFLALIHRHRVRIRYGPPVDLASLRGCERAPDAPERASALIMDAIWALAPDLRDDR